MRELNCADYFECLAFHDKVLDVIDNKVELDGVYIKFENEINEDKMQFAMLNHGGYWCFGAVTQSDKIVISVGVHE